MFSIGIVDITTVGSTICQRRISELGGAKGEHPEFVVHSLPFSEYRACVMTQNWPMMAKLVLTSIAQLSKCNVDFIIIPSNTPHYAYELFSEKSPIPILHLIQLSAQACQKANLKKVAVLGTKATMNGGLYAKPFEELGIELVLPNDAICKAIDQFIMEAIIPDKVEESQRREILAMIQTIEADGFVLACTELPEVFCSKEIGKIAIDTTRTLAEIAFDLATKKDKTFLAKLCQKIEL